MMSKAELRRHGYAVRRALEDKPGASRRAIAQILSHPAYVKATSCLWYLDCRSELRTQWVFPQLLTSGKQIVIPYCTTDDDGHNRLGLWRIESLDELTAGKWKILEPPTSRWAEPERQVTAAELDLVVVPGVAFDRHGHRVGSGQGYYDRLLADVREDCVTIGLCFECQCFEEVPVEAHDVAMDWVATEMGLLKG